MWGSGREFKEGGIRCGGREAVGSYSGFWSEVVWVDFGCGKVIFVVGLGMVFYCFFLNFIFCILEIVVVRINGNLDLGVFWKLLVG